LVAFLVEVAGICPIILLITACVVNELRSGCGSKKCGGGGFQKEE
jgi:hypothetical protein